MTGLKPGQEYVLRVSAGNSQGRATAVTLSHLTPIDIAEKRLSKTPNATTGYGVLPTVLGILAGVVCMVLLCCVLLVLLLKARSNGRRKEKHATKITLDEPAEDSVAIKSDGEPDVILVSEGKKKL